MPEDTKRRLPELIRLGFQPGASIKDATIEVHSIGSLVCPTGRIVAADPLVFPESPAFNRSVPPGQYPVLLSVARFANDARVAFAMLRFAEQWPDRWELAVVPGADGSAGDLGYPVDAGLGCFMDADAQTALLARLEASPDLNYYDDVLGDELDAHSDPKGTWQWTMHQPDPRKPSTLAVFSSGFGDGAYPTYWGIWGDRVVSLVTAFLWW